MLNTIEALLISTFLFYFFLLTTQIFSRRSRLFFLLSSTVIGVSILVLGFSNFFWVPVATQFGRRPAAILSCIVSMGAMIWKAKAETSSSFMVSTLAHYIIRTYKYLSTPMSSSTPITIIRPDK